MYCVSVVIIIFCIYIGAYIYRKNMELLTGKQIQECVINSIYIKANIGKYLPGNVFHFAGRNYLGKQFNLNQKALLGSTILQHVQSVTLSLLLPLILDFKIYRTIINLLKDLLGKTYILIGGALITAIILLIIYFYKQFEIPFKELFINFPKKSLGKIIGNLLITGAYLLLYGISFFIITYSINSNGWDIRQFIMVIVSFIVAWFCGLIVIGAPGGIGVREVALLFLLRNAFSEADLMIIVVLHRFCTISADALSFILEVIKEKIIKKTDD